MKKILFILLMLGACNEPDFDPGLPVGCATGIKDGKRQLMRCCTEKEFNAGNNVSVGGFAAFLKYTDRKWEQEKNCKTCYLKYP